MSDEEYEYEYDEDASGDAMSDGGDARVDEDEEFEYTDQEDDADDMDISLENAYYNAKGFRETSVKDAITALESVISLEQSGKQRQGIWGYKALKQLTKLYLREQNIPTSIATYQRLLDLIANPMLEGVSPNAVEKGVNGMLERISSAIQKYSSFSMAGLTEEDAIRMARNVYDSTIAIFHPRTGTCPNERLWFKTNLKYGQLLYEIHDVIKLELVIKDLFQSTNIEATTNDDMNPFPHYSSSSSSSSYSSTHLMEIYALQIQLYSRQKDNAKLRSVFFKSLNIQSGSIPHPRTVALIQELGGKMYMARREFEAAGPTFFQAFKSYDEAGDHPARIRCLRYLVMASMLHASSINPFDSQEARPYRDDPDIVAMTKLVQALHNNDISTFERVLSRNEGKIMNDEFLREYIGDLLKTIRSQVLLKVIVPYERIQLSSISKNFLNGIDVKDVESLLVGLILDGKIQGKIDQVHGVWEKSKISNDIDMKRYEALDQITDTLKRLASSTATGVTSTKT
jgi:COP9 signalosome complex subunit 2